ncbi:MAG: TetR/AcrR family transcriptional regulator [Deltaproteobacteria bacterium]|nr:TetR/AcrR family transcriptional regulator [Deltaproteobacteria bacterium]
MEVSASAPTAAKVDRRMAQDARTRQRILDAAGYCFAERGLRGTTLEDVAAAAHVSKPLIYKHFDGKSGLVDAVIEQVHVDWWAASSRGIDTAKSAADALATKFRATIEAAEKRPLLRAILRQDLTFLSAEHRAHFARARAQSRQRTVDILRWGVRAGEFRVDINVEPTADALETVLAGLVTRILRTSHAGSVSEHLVAATLALLTRGLMAEPHGHTSRPDEPRANSPQ